MSIKARAFYAVDSVIGVDNRQNLINDWRDAVVVFVLQEHNCVAPFSPNRGVVDRGDDCLNIRIALVDQGRVEAGLRAVVIRIRLAFWPGITAAVLVIALVWSDE